MKASSAISAATALIASAAAAAALRWWLAEPPVVERRVPVLRNQAPAGNAGSNAFPAHVSRSLAPLPPPAPGEWPQFRGPKRDNVSPEPVRLQASWGAAGPRVAWSADLGEGHAGPAVHRGRIYVLDYDETAGADTLRCFALADGAEIWRTGYAVKTKRNHGVSRTVPAVSDRYVVSVGPQCHAMCADAETGAFLWGMDLARRYQSEVPLWYTAQCPLMDGEVAILAPGGRALMVAVDCASGNVVWETPNPRGWKMSHASVMPMSFGGERAYVYCALGGIAAVAAEGPRRGQLLWETDLWKHAVVAPSAVDLGNGRLFVTAGYGVGSRLLQVAPRSGGGFDVASVFQLDRSVFACEQQTPVLFEGHLFGVLPSDAGALNRQLACLRPDGTLAWTSGSAARFGLGPFVIGDGKIFVLRDDGVLTMAEARTDQYRELARHRVLDGRDAWGPMALTAGRLLVRDSKRLVCLDLRAEEQP